MVDFTRYTPPGVYVEASADQSIITTTGAPTATVTIVGLASGYQVHTQSLALTTPPTALAKKGVLPDSDSSPDLTVTTASGDELVEGTDYTLVRGANPDEATTIARATSATVNEGEIVVVNYSYSDQFYYSPKSFEDFTSVENTYGQALLQELPEDPDGSQVHSPLSLAARLAFENGASNIIALAVEPPAGTEDLRDRFAQAYLKLANSYAHTMIVPVFDTAGRDAATYTAAISGFISDIRAHCASQAADGFGRLAIVGADVVHDESDLAFDDLAGDIHSSRVVLAYPSRMTFFNNALNQSTEVGGCYLAAAYAGVLASNEVNRGLTQQAVHGFTGIPEAIRSDMSRNLKNTLSAAGVAVTEPGRTNSLVIRHGVTTDPSDLVSREVSLTRTSDSLYQLVSEGILAQELIGDPIDEETTTRVKGVLTSILEGAIDNRVILEWVDLLVRQQALPGGDPTVIECVFSYRPFLPLNYITVQFTMDLATGEVAPAEELVAV